MRFETLPLHESLSRGIESLGFSECTPIQADALPLLLAGQDMAGQAQTGTGKTAAFLLAAMQYLLTRGQGRLRAGRPRALIVAPTRELAVQIHSDAKALGRYTGLRLALVYGGVDYEQQRNSLRQPVDILIGTPGRLIDYYRQRVISWQDLSVVVLDEADRMFDLGFIRDVRFLLRRMPPPEQRLSMLFTATLPWRVTELAYEHMNNPELIRIRPDKITVDGVSQQLYHISNEDKMALLVGLLRRINPQRTIIFVNTRRGADWVHGCLQGNDFRAAILTGDIPQRQRLRLFQDFSQGVLPILVATDLAARGLHIPEVSHVFNYDLPFQPEDYVHRIGRTARAGGRGDAVSLACEEYVYSLPDIEQFLGYKLPVEPVADELLAELQPPKRRRRPREGAARGRRSGPRRSGSGPRGF